MASYFCISVRFLNQAFHGRSDGGVQEWPPSPLRVFQAIVASAARLNDGRLPDNARLALQWLESQPEPPTVIAPPSQEGNGYRLSVPNNAMDVVARAWSRGNESNSGDANPATHRTMKGVRPTIWKDEEAIQFVWPIAEPIGENVAGHAAVLSRSAGSVVALGWGLDVAVGHAAVISEQEFRQLSGERWLPGDGPGENSLRCPIQGTLEDVLARHERFLNRLEQGTLVAPSPITVFARTEYRRTTQPSSRPVAAFSLLRLDASGFRPFDAATRGLTVAGMLRGAVKAAAERDGWPESKIAAFVLGHGEANGARAHITVGAKRFAFLPLPSIEARKDAGASAGSIRRVIVMSFAGRCEDEIEWAQRVISGQELRDENGGRAVALLSLIPGNDKVVRRYTQAGTVWKSVTPVVLPGYDDPRHYRRRMERGVGADEQRRLLEQLDARVDGLLRKAIVQAGFSEDLAANAGLDWRKSGFWPGTEMADRYGVPDHLKRFPRYHVRIQWRDSRGAQVNVPGPICVGAGRFYGVGLLAAE
jgi:CRISPR-associated protein Csb2